MAIKLTELDFLNKMPKCIQYKDLADKGDFSNPFYLCIDSKELIGSRYEIFGGRWTLKIISYNSENGTLRGVPLLYPDMPSMTFKAIPIEEGIKNMYKHGVDILDYPNLQRLIALKAMK